MGMVVPIDLVRLRSATAAYVAILYDSLPRLERLTAPDTGPNPRDAELMARLRDCIEGALDIDDAPGTPAAILTILCHLLGVGPLAAAVSAPAGPASASEMQVHL
jgi:hypothetical protein